MVARRAESGRKALLAPAKSGCRWHAVVFCALAPGNTKLFPQPLITISAAQLYRMDGDRKTPFVSSALHSLVKSLLVQHHRFRSRISCYPPAATQTFWQTVYGRIPL